MRAWNREEERLHNHFDDMRSVFKSDAIVRFGL
jgi:hypothetical protein